MNHGEMTLSTIRVASVAMRLEVSFVLLRLLFTSRGLARALPNLWIVCCVLSAASLVRLFGFSRELLNFPRNEVMFALSISLSFCWVAWLSIITMELVTENRALRRAHSYTIITIIGLFGAATLDRIQSVYIYLPIAVYLDTLFLLWMLVSRRQLMLSRDRALIFFGTFVSSGYLLLLIRLVLRLMKHVQFNDPVAIAVPGDIAQGFILIGIPFAFVYLQSANRLLFRDLTICIWIAYVYVSCLIAASLQQAITTYSLLSRPVNVSVVLVITITMLMAVAAVISRKLPLLVESHALGAPDWEERRFTFSHGLGGLERKETVIAFTVDTLSKFLGIEEVSISLLSDSAPSLEFPENEVTQDHRSSSGMPSMLRTKSRTHTFSIGQDLDQSLALKIYCLGEAEHLLPSEVSFVKDVMSLVENRLSKIEAIRLRENHTAKETELRQSLVEAELRALRSQIDPHFLFNTLNGIAEQAIRDPELAEVMTMRLAETFRYILVHADQQAVALSEELKFAEAYMWIQQSRFGDRLTFVVDVPNDLLDLRVPALLLQPLLENAIKFCIAPSIEGGTISVYGKRLAGRTELRVENRRQGMDFLPDDPMQSTRLGLKNTLDRLRLVCGTEAKLQLFHADGWAEVVISMPS